MISLPYYTSSAGEATNEVIRDTCAAVDLEAERVPAEQTNANPDSSVFLVSEDEWDFEIRFDSDSDGQAPVPEIVIAGTSWFSDPWENDVGDDEYQRRVDRLFELICRLAMGLEVEYAPMLGFVDPLQCWPTDYPITDNIEELPIFGIYSQSALEDLGGLSEMFDRSPWYVARLPTGHTIVIQEDFPWNKRDWTPPTDAEFLETTSLSDPDEFVQQVHYGFADPFASLETGEIGTDLCVPREKIGPEFRNEDLELVRVRVDEQRDLRRVDDGSFVRNVVDDDPGDPAAFMNAQLSDVPADATDDDLMVSALLREVPPTFVRLQDPGGETIVTKVMALDIDVAKVDLLISLGRVVQEMDAGVTDDDLREIEAFLESLEGLEDVEGIEQRIRDRLR